MAIAQSGLFDLDRLVNPLLCVIQAVALGGQACTPVGRGPPSWKAPSRNWQCAAQPHRHSGRYDHPHKQPGRATSMLPSGGTRTPLERSRGPGWPSVDGLVRTPGQAMKAAGVSSFR